MNAHHYRTTFAALLIGALFPIVASAAETVTLSIPSPEEFFAGDTISVPLNAVVLGEVGINSLGATVNIEGPATLTSVHTGNSVFSLWPEFAIQDARTLVFLGGSPASVGGSSLRIVTLELSVQGEGEITITVSDAKAFAGDGVGTPIAISALTSRLHALAKSGSFERDASQETRSRDATPPQRFEISVGRDASVFDGQYFLSFNAVDAETGIERYEVEEEPFTPVVSQGTYIVRDQSMSSPITVRAYDAAGNVREESLNITRAWMWEPWLYVVVALLILVLLLLSIRAWMFRRRPILS
jgi:hypothetical protein